MQIKDNMAFRQCMTKFVADLNYSLVAEDLSVLKQFHVYFVVDQTIIGVA